MFELTTRNLWIMWNSTQMKKEKYLCCIFPSLWEKFHQILRKKIDKSSPHFNSACGLVTISGI
jgi:hypothetical protein